MSRVAACLLAFVVLVGCGNNRDAAARVLLDAARAQERHFERHDRYTDDVDALQDAGLELPDGMRLSVPALNNSRPGNFARSYCLELVAEGSVYHYDDLGREVSPGRCGDFWIPDPSATK